MADLSGLSPEELATRVLCHYSSLALWAYSEYTAGVLVLCGPSIPRACDQIWNSRVFASLRFWMRFGARDHSQLLAHHSGHSPNFNPGIYDQIDTPSGNIILVRLKQTGSRIHPARMVRKHGLADIQVTDMIPLAVNLYAKPLSLPGTSPLGSWKF